MAKTLHLLYAVTVDFIPHAAVGAVAVKENLKNKNTKLFIHILYSKPFRQVREQEKTNIFEALKYTFLENNIEYKLYDINSYLYLFNKLGNGAWRKEAAVALYMYLCAPKIISDIDKVIYIDTDMLVNCDLEEVYDIDMADNLVVMAEAPGYEQYPDMSNAGFVMLNLKQWRKENTLEALLDFGSGLKDIVYCDQSLLYHYFTRKNPDKISYINKMYNIFPRKVDIPLEDIYIWHFTAINSKPWNDYNFSHRGMFLWWKYARKTYFYEKFLNRLFEYRMQQEFKMHKLFFAGCVGNRYVLTLFGIKFKFRIK